MVKKYGTAATATAKSLQSCPTLCSPIDGSPPGSPVPGILQARTLEWVAISFSNAWKGKVKVKLLSHVWPSVTPWTAAFQAPLPMGFSRQEYWSGVPLPTLGQPPSFPLSQSLPSGRFLSLFIRGPSEWKTTKWSYGWQPCLTQWNSEPSHGPWIGPPKTDGSW